MMILFKRMFSALILTACLASSASAQHLHVFMLLDTDDRHGESFRRDGLMIANMLEDGLPPSDYTVRTLMGSDATNEKLLAEISSANVNQDDSVLFYYSGHGGFNRSTEQHLFTLNHSKQPLLRSAVRSAIDRHSPRLSVMLSDCCASYLKPEQIEGYGGGSGDSAKEIPVPILVRKLFFETDGSVDITSSRPGQVSVGLPEGGVFTLAFTKVVNAYQFEALTWSNVFEKTRRVAGERFEVNRSEKAIKATGQRVQQRTQTAWSFGTMYGVDPNTVRLGVTPCVDCGKHVTEVMRGSAAERAGLEQGDMILAVNGVPVESAKHLGQLVNNSTAKLKLLVRNVRNGENLELNVKLPY